MRAGQEENGGGDAGKGGAPAQVAAPPPDRGGKADGGERRGVPWEDKLWADMTDAERDDWLRLLRKGVW